MKKKISFTFRTIKCLVILNSRQIFFRLIWSAKFKFAFFMRFNLENIRIGLIKIAYFNNYYGKAGKFFYSTAHKYLDNVLSLVYNYSLYAYEMSHVFIKFLGRYTIHMLMHTRSTQHMLLLSNS